MRTAKKPNGKKPKIQASDVQAGNRTLDAVLLDLAEQSKENAARSAEYAASMAESRARMALIDERSARAEERSVRAEEGIRIALENIASLTRDQMALSGRTGKIEARVEALEKAS
jgi:hypothetical protein